MSSVLTIHAADRFGAGRKRANENPYHGASGACRSLTASKGNIVEAGLVTEKDIAINGHKVVVTVNVPPDGFMG